MKPTKKTTKKPPSPRRYPRAEVGTKARITVPGERLPRFEAVLSAANVSVGGVFFESTFFLKLGQRVQVELQLEPRQAPIRALGPVIRIEQLSEKKGSRSGFAVKFDEYLDGSDLALARYFLAPALRSFVTTYARNQRLRPSPQYLEDAVSLLAAWELSKSEATAIDLWALSEEPAGPERKR